MDQASKYKWVGFKLQHMHSDGGAELVSDKILTFLHQRGISTSHTPRDTPEMNSTVERRVRDIKERTLSMLLHSGLPVPFWWLALRTAVYLQNRMPTKTVCGYLTSYECMRQVPPNLRHLRIWGSRAYVLKPKAERLKDFDAKRRIQEF